MATAADPNVDPFASIGGGIYANGSWIPKSMAGQQMSTGGMAPTSGATTSGSTAPQPAAPPAAPAATNVNDQAQAASTYSATPGANPVPYTTNQGTQDVVRNSYLAQATQGTQVNPNDPALKQQTDAYNAGVERKVRDYVADQAESLGPDATGALRGQTRMANEQAGQAEGGFSAQVVGQELQNRRTEIQNALSQLSGLMTQDQQAALQQKLADLDAQIKTLGINTDAGTAAAQLALQGKLGTAGIGVDLLKLSQGDQQFSDNMAYNIANLEANYNNLGLRTLLGL